MQLYDPTKHGAPRGGFLNSVEKKRLVVMIIVFVLVTGAFVTLKPQGEGSEADATVTSEPKTAAELPTEIVAPNIDVAALEAAASDGTSEQRASFPAAAIEAGFMQSGKVYDGSFAALGGRELTAQLAAEILRAPKEQRGKLFRARCSVEALRDPPTPETRGQPRHFARGRLEDGATCFLAVQEFVGLAPVPGDFVRVDGLFVSVHREEIDGQWREGPLLAGPSMHESFARLAPVTELDAHAFDFVHDDNLEQGTEGLDDESYWTLVSYAKNLAPGKVDWNEAALLDNQTIQSVLEDGSAWRGKPVRLSEARMLNIWTQVQGENPLRMKRIVEGWFTRGDWHGSVKVAHFSAPFDELPRGVHKAMEVNLHAFFYKNLAYTKQDGGLAIAPFFVLQSVEEFAQPDLAGLRQMTYIVAGTLIALGIGIVFVLRHDRAKSDELCSELIRSRRKRREEKFRVAKS